MITYEVTNLLPTSLTIEDIGVNLQPAGGSSSTRVLSEHTYKSSTHIRSCEQRKWVKVVIRKSFDPKPIPVWPFSKAPAPAQSPPPIVVSAPSHSETVLMGLIHKLEGLVNRAQTVAVAPAAAPVSSQAPMVDSTPTLRVVEKVIEAPEPMFIPSRIVPQNAEVRIRVDESSKDDDEFASGADALRSLRKKDK